MPPDEIMYPFGEISRLFLPSEETKEWNTLLLDDVQLMRQENDQQALCALIRDCPDRRFWLLSRGLIPICLTPFQVEGGLTVITAQDLMLDRESTGLLLQAYGVTVSDVMLIAIYEENHGYALAVTLLARINGDTSVVVNNTLTYLPNVTSILISFGGAFLVMM